ncbi:MAG: toxin-antitoxin system YwqK family antitoxin [Bacteroidota bacterium]
MKYLFVSLSLLCFLQMNAQNAKTTPAVMSAAPEKTKQGNDTVITKDPVNSDREYWMILDASRNLKMQGQMVKGLKEGTWREYGGVNSTIQKVDEFKSGKLNGMSSTFNASGMITSDETYRNDTLNGRRMLFTGSGRVKLVEHYKNGLLDGERYSYYDDGKLQEEGKYINGKRDGITKWYSQNGNLSLQYTYTNGDLNGLAKQFDDKGLIRQEGDFVNNNEEGEWKEYEGGVLVKKILYKAGTVTKETQVRK